LKAISPLVATLILIMLCIVAAFLVYICFFNTADTFSSKDQVMIEAVDLVIQTDGYVTFSITVKNTGNKPVKELTVQLGSEDPIDFPDVSESSPLQPGRTTMCVLTSGDELEKNYVGGNSYIVCIEATFTDGSTFSYATSIRCRGAGEGGEPSTSNFQVSVSPKSSSIFQGESTTAIVSVSLEGGSARTVTLSASNLPTGVTASFDPMEGTPPFTSTLTISTSESTPTGTYSITITATYADVTRTTSFTLVVIPEDVNTAILEGADFVFGFSRAEADKWVDGATGKEYPLLSVLGLGAFSDAVGSPTGPEQTSNTLLYLWYSDFVYGWANRETVYRSSSSEVVGSESSQNIFSNFGPLSTEAVGSPTGEIQENNAVIYIWGHSFMYGFASKETVYRPSSSEVAGDETSANIILKYNTCPENTLAFIFVREPSFSASFLKWIFKSSRTYINE